MFRKNLGPIIGLIIIAVISTGLYLTTRKEVFSIHGAEYNVGNVVVLAIQPPKSEQKTTMPSTDQSTYIANGTLFLLMKNHDKLFFLPSFQQIATFSPQNLFHKNSPIFSYLFMGRYERKDNTIHYIPLSKANVESLYFYKKCLTPEAVQKLSKEIEAVKYLSATQHLDAGSITFNTKNNVKKTVLIGHWIYNHKVLSAVKLKPDTKRHIDDQLEVCYREQEKNKPDNFSIEKTNTDQSQKNKN